MDKQERVAYLGPKASYTHQATLSVFPPSPSTILHPASALEDVFSAVQSAKATAGVVPFENSTNGPVVFTLDLFADLQHKYPDIIVCDEIYVAVHHCLLGRPHPSLPTPDATPHPTPPRAEPLTSLSHIKKLYSHPQAWGQCKAFLSAYLKGIERQDVSSTSKAAEIVAADRSGTSAAVSSSIAAEVHGLDFLARDIEDTANNATRFFVLRKRGPTSRAATVVGRDADGDPQKWKTLVLFTVDHADPGALADSLGVFKKHRINLTSINARPSGVAQWNYIFFVEFAGREGQEKVDGALGELERFVRGWRSLGGWRNRLLEQQ
ncbi:Prephenate dehydratase-domain-containing protein [Cryomyces antarcticus]